MEKCIRASFYENLTPDKYLDIIVDYIDMSKQLGIPVDPKLPKEILKIHDVLTEQIVYIKNLEIEKMFNKRVEANEKLLNFAPKSDEFTIVNPEKPTDLIEEGKAMSHCVGSYIDRVSSGFSKIFFIRKKSSVDKPFVTLELNKFNSFVQASAFANKRPNEDTMKFILQWIENIKNDVK
jgi:hypothetical protein